MKGKAVIPLALGLCLGLVAVKYVVDTLKKAQASSGTQRNITVVRAKQDIGAFSLLTPELLEQVETTDSSLAPATERVSKIEDLKDRVTAKAIPRSSLVLQSMLAPPGTPHGMEGRIKPGYRAVSVKIDEVTGVAYQVQPGDLVDVIVVMDIESGSRGKKKETIAEVLLQKVEVAAIGQSTTSTTEDAASKVKPAKSATLLVPEEDAPKLHLAQTRGKITLSMRGKDDETTGAYSTAHSDELFRALKGLTEKPEVVASAQRPVEPHAPPPPAVTAIPFGVTVYRRSTAANAQTNIERITFEHARSSKVIDVADSPVRQTTAMLRGGRAGSAARLPQGPDMTDEDVDTGAAPQPSTNPVPKSE